MNKGDNWNRNEWQGKSRNQVESSIKIITWLLIVAGGWVVAWGLYRGIEVLIDWIKGML